MSGSPVANPKTGTDYSTFITKYIFFSILHIQYVFAYPLKCLREPQVEYHWSRKCVMSLDVSQIYGPLRPVARIALYLYQGDGDNWYSSNRPDGCDRYTYLQNKENRYFSDEALNCEDLASTLLNKLIQFQAQLIPVGSKDMRFKLSICIISLLGLYA
jgi:hypothetical protein